MSERCLGCREFLFTCHRHAAHTEAREEQQLQLGASAAALPAAVGAADAADSTDSAGTALHAGTGCMLQSTACASAMNMLRTLRLVRSSSSSWEHLEPPCQQQLAQLMLPAWQRALTPAQVLILKHQFLTLRT